MPACIYRLTQPHLRETLLTRIAAGELPSRICAEPGMPSWSSVSRWSHEDPAFGERLAQARRVGMHRYCWQFDEAKAKVLLARLAAGESIMSIIADPAMPTWPVYTYWRANQGEFAEAVHRLNKFKWEARAARAAAAFRVFDPVVADRVVLAIMRGARLRPPTAIHPDFPGLATLARWRREQPDFDQTLRKAIRIGRRVRKAAGPPPAMVDKILDRLSEGLSLHQVSLRPGMPCAQTLYAWRRRHPAFAATVASAYAFTRERREDARREAIMARFPELVGVGGESEEGAGAAKGGT
jgi:hypothetical protein